jgi:hypothetical protein
LVKGNSVGSARKRDYDQFMGSAENHPPFSLGLVGDGDEISAIADVERHFCVRLDYVDSAGWTTVGDVFASLQRMLPAEQGAGYDSWLRFVEVISLETGVDPSRVVPETLLLEQDRFDRRALVILAMLIGLMFAVIRH